MDTTGRVRLGFGAAVIGDLYVPISDEQAVSTVDAAWAAGIRYFDTAPHYGAGLSERRLGRALRERRRDEFVVSTKVGRLLEPDGRRRFDFGLDGVRRSLDASLSRLGLDRVDIVLVHDPDDHLDQAIDEAIPALLELRAQGVIREVGVGMNQWQAPLRVVRETDLDVVMLAGRWTLLDRSGRPLLDECLPRGVTVLAAGPFNSGLLASSWPADDARYEYRPAPPEVLARARALASTCRANGVELPAAALQFPLRHKAVRAVVAGMGTPEEVRTDAARVSAPIPDQLWREVSDE